MRCEIFEKLFVVRMVYVKTHGDIEYAEKNYALILGLVF